MAPEWQQLLDAAAQPQRVAQLASGAQASEVETEALPQQQQRGPFLGSPRLEEAAGALLVPPGSAAQVDCHMGSSS